MSLMQLKVKSGYATIAPHATKGENSLPASDKSPLRLLNSGVVVS